MKASSKPGLLTMKILVRSLESTTRPAKPTMAIVTQTTASPEAWPDMPIFEDFVLCQRRWYRVDTGLAEALHQRGGNEINPPSPHGQRFVAVTQHTCDAKTAWMPSIHPPRSRLFFSQCMNVPRQIECSITPHPEVHHVRPRKLGRISPGNAENKTRQANATHCPNLFSAAGREISVFSTVGGG